MSEWTHSDHADDTITIRPFGYPELPGVAVEINEGAAVHIPPHEWPELCRAGYRALDLPVPDLPEIIDPALLDRLAKDLHYARHGTTARTIAFEREARTLLSLGWRKDGAS